MIDYTFLLRIYLSYFALTYCAEIQVLMMDINLYIQTYFPMLQNKTHENKQGGRPRRENPGNTRENILKPRKTHVEPKHTGKPHPSKHAQKPHPVTHLIPKGASKMILSGNKPHVKDEHHSLRNLKHVSEAVASAESQNTRCNIKTDKGIAIPPQLKQVMSGWDKMLVAKTFPGLYNVPYVAGMNVTSLPTNTFAVS